MELDKNKQLKFHDGSKTKVIIKSMGMEESNFGSEYVVHIEETKGCDHFKPSEGLRNKIAEASISEGDKIIIEKVAPSEKYKYGYFSVDMADNQPKKQETNFDKVEMDKYATGENKAVDPAVHNHPVGAGFAQKDDKMAVHELSLRVETLEKQVTQLLKDKLPF